MTYDVFLSYSQKDRELVDRLVDDLRDHGIEVWLDTAELSVGDATHATIEDGIASSRFFCIALSPASLDSYYVRQVEFEQAFDRMVREQRSGYILPIVVAELDRELPGRLGHLFRLDFTSPAMYSENVRKVAKKIRGVDSNFTGERWFKGLNISNLGEPVGVGPVAQMAGLGQSYKMRWADGIVDRVDVYLNGKLVHYKEFGLDTEGRVIENRMYSRDENGEWRVIEDVWHYEYDPVSGKRSTKTMRFVGATTYRVVSYDAQGRAIEERIETAPGEVPDRTYAYAKKVFLYDGNGNQSGERLYDDAGAEISGDTAG